MKEFNSKEVNENVRSIGWEKLQLYPHSSIREAIEILNETAMKVILVTESSGVLLGTVSDGDIRRGLLKGLNLASPLSGILRKRPIVVTKDVERKSVLAKMLSNKIQQIPIVDDCSRVIGIYLWDDLNSVRSIENSMVIMAGGKGTRLLPKTESTPKPMLKIAEKPILEHIIENAKRDGFSHFILAIHHMGDQITNYFGSGDTLGVRIEYVQEQSPLGTAGALSLLNPIPKTPIVVTNGDVLSKVSFRDILNHHEQNNAEATMAVRSYEWQNPFGVVMTQGLEIMSYEEKPVHSSLVNAGVYVLEPTVLSLLERSQHCDMPTLFDFVRKQGLKTIAFPIHESWIDVGRPEDLERAISGFPPKLEWEDKL